MAALFTLQDLAVWTRTTIASDDEFALAVVDAASLLVAETARQPAWDISTVPARAKLIAILLAKRSYLNPDAIASSTVGPLTERTVEDFARTMELTPAEIEVLESMQGENSISGFWIQPTSRGELESSLFIPLQGEEETGDWLPYLDPDKDPYYWPLLEQP